MKEHPIIFNGEMVKAVLEGHKTQTRRVIPSEALARATLEYADCTRVYSRYGEPGDQLWVRESFMPLPVDLPERDKSTRWNISYGADGAQRVVMAPSDYNPMLYNYERWSPSIHMPRWASRITLEVLSIHVQRVNEISEDDAVAEGIDGIYGIQGFSELWDKINFKRGFGWDTNPWIWRIQFRRVENGA